jgi:HSP20 family molecular chaperone IbpA
MPNYYEILGVSHKATTAEIRQSFRTLALRHHPDKNKNSEESKQKFMAVVEAYEVLSDEQARRNYDGHSFRVPRQAPGWTPPADLYETPSEFVLTAELPGLKREQIDIHAEDGRVIIRGARAAGPGRDIPCEQYHRVERGHGRFSRTFALPEPIQVDAISAEFKDGILTVTIPKAADRSARKINVS